MNATVILRKERSKFVYKFSLLLNYVDVNNVTFSSDNKGTLGANDWNILFLIYKNICKALVEPLRPVC